MKKKLLFSLLLGSAFAWMNEMYAAADAEPAVEAGTNAGAKAAEQETLEKAYKAKGLDGKEIEVRFFDKSNHSGVTKVLNLQDGGTYSNMKVNVPYMAGVPMPEGAAVVYVGRKKDNTDELILVPADADIGTFTDYSFDPKEYWMYFDGKYLYPYKEIPDTNAQLILGKKASIYQYEVPDEESTALKKEADDAKKELATAQEQLKEGGGAGGASSEELTKLKADLEAKTKELAEAEEKLKAGGGTGGVSPEETEALKKEIDELEKGLRKAIADLKAMGLSGTKSESDTPRAAPVADPSAPLTATFAFKGAKFVVMSSDPKAREHEDLFKELVTNLEGLFSTQPHVAAAVISQMVKENADSPKDPGIKGSFAVADIYKLAGRNVAIVADLSFASEFPYAEAKTLKDKLRTEYGKVSEAAKEAEAGAGAGAGVVTPGASVDGGLPTAASADAIHPGADTDVAGETSG
jgi:hypothetical protein